MTSSHDRPEEEGGERTELQLLFDSAHSGNLEELGKWLASLELTPDITDNAGYSLLHIAAFRGYSDMVSFLLDQGATVDQTDNALHTPLHFAASEGNLECIKILLTRGANISARNKFMMVIIEDLIPVYVVGAKTPLHYAAEYGQLDCASYLIANGADVSLKDSDGYTPFQLASLYKRYDVAQILNPSPESELVPITPGEFQWRWNVDYRRRSERAAVQYRETLNGDCCYPCKYLESLRKGQ